MSTGGGTPSMDELRLKYGYRIVIIGLAVVGAVFVSAVARWAAAADVTAVVGAVTGVVGTVVGAFFGAQIGSAGREKAETERMIAEQKALRFASYLQPDVAISVLKDLER